MNTESLKKRVGLFVFTIFFLPVFGQAQIDIPSSAQPVRLNPFLLHSPNTKFSFHPQQVYPSSLKNRTLDFTLLQPERLPLFCALEKKLTEACNIWIKIRVE